MVDDFGKYLKSEREMRGIPLEEIAESTKIQMCFLEALETNYYEAIPGEIFVRGFVHSYAKAIGADIEGILSEFDQTIGCIRKDKFLKEERDKNETYLRSLKFYRLMSVIAVILILGCVSFGVSNLFGVLDQESISSSEFTKNSSSDKAKKNDPILAEPLDEEKSIASSNISLGVVNTVSANSSAPFKKIGVAKKTEKQKDMEVVSKNDTTEGIESKNNSISMGALELTIRVKQESWFHLVIDGGSEKDFILPQGTGKTFRGESKFKITVGNSQGVQLALNGRILNLPKSENNVLRDFLIEPGNTG
tara:strand:- start:109 stop:1026 length:918 start_codon:yes stop_codon:yes gene_type:complete